MANIIFYGRIAHGVSNHPLDGNKQQRCTGSSTQRAGLIEEEFIRMSELSTVF